MKAGRQDREQCEREMEEMFGFVPEFYDAVPDSVVQHAWGIQRDFQLADTALDMKTKELIGLAVASQLKCRYCVYFHTQAAKAHGASEEELLEAVAMGGMTDMFSNMITGARIDFDRFQREVDRAIEHMKAHLEQAMERMDEAQL
jgi:AhpD family alkylhydroperoxidase